MSADRLRFSLEEPASFLSWLGDGRRSRSFGDVTMAEVWALVGLATLARRDSQSPVEVADSVPWSEGRKFAHAIGFDDIVAGTSSFGDGDIDRTVKMRRVTSQAHIEPAARRIANFVLPPKEEDSRNALFYVLVEALRNAVQHSHDPLGCVVAAQRNERGRHANRPTIQVAVADAGIGIPQSLTTKHPALSHSEEALEKSLWPHISGTFEEGLTGTAENAGMGLFFIAEMAKLLAGRLVIASRGATLELIGDEEGLNQHRIGFVEPKGLGYSGTLVAFELPIGEVKDYGALMEAIRERARLRTPSRATSRWLRFEAAPPEVQEYLVNIAAENTIAALQFGREAISQALLAHKPVALNFLRIPVCTQSFVHALLFESLRLAWALRIPIYVTNAQPAVRSNLELLENYALAG